MTTQKIAKNIFWLLSEHGTRMLVGLLVAAIMARQLGVEQYGLFQYALGLAAVFSSISFICGAEVLVPMLTTADIQKRQQVMGNAFVVRLFFSAIAYIALVLFAFLTEEPPLFYLIALLGTAMLFSESFAVVTAWLQSQTNSKPRSILVMCSLAVKAGLMGLLYYLGFNNPLYYALAYILDPLIIALGLLIIFYKKTGQSFFNYSFPIAYDLFKKGLPFFWGLMAMFAFLRLDVIMLKQLSDLQTLGHYAAAMELLKSVTALSGILAGSMAPMLVYQYDDIAIIRKKIYMICLIMLVIAVMTAVIVQIVAPYFIPILFGASYIQSIPILSWLSWAACLYFLNEGLNLFIVKMGAGRLVLYKWLLALFVATVANYFLIPKYNAFGAVFGYSLGYLSTIIFGLWVVFKWKKA